MTILSSVSNNRQKQRNPTSFRQSLHLKMLIAVLILAACALPAAAADVPTVTITEYKVSPSVMMPDSLGTIAIMVKNTATSASLKENTGLYTTEATTTKVTDINVNIENVKLEGNGIIVRSNDFQRVGEIGPGQSIQLTFSIQAPSKSGMFFPEVWIDTTGGTSTRYPIPVNVNTAVGIERQAILIMSSTLTGSVNPGDEIPVTLTVSNAGQTLADDVILRIENVSATVAPKNSDAYHLGAILAGGQKTVDMALLSDKKSDSGLVRIPVLISYHAIDGTQRTQETGIDVIMKGKAELGFVSVDTNPPRLIENTAFDLTVRIENTGSGEAKQVSAKIDLPVEGTREAFIGKIKPGNDAPAIFLLEGLKGGNYPYNLTITYTDDMGVHTLSRPMNVRVQPADMSGTIIFGLIILIILGVVGYRYWYLPRINGAGKFPWDKKN
ncbi:MAG: S-layer protein [Methanoregula sp.]|nr:S-layer protein [Methanoregula sp.]